MNIITLNSQNLPQIKTPVSVPGYDRGDLSPSIVHIGFGNFHRAHQAACLDELLERGQSKAGIFAINLIPDAFPLADILPAQDFLYTLVTKSAAGEERARVCGPVVGYLNAAANREAALRRMADNGTSLITLTVTEGGYHYDRDFGEINCMDEAVRGDLERGADPKTVAACIAAALELRYKSGRSPLTIMSCDNIPSNGRVLKNCVLFFCRELYPEIVSWVEDSVAFPSSMVDRITPVTSAGLVEELQARYGISDRWPVCAEDFRQWVLEDDFKSPVPCYEEAGVQIVKDAAPYELMKMRLLNGSHSAMAYTSYLLGLRTVDEGITHPLIESFIRRRYMEEVTPTLPPVPGIDLDQYKDTLISRFSNKNIADTIARLAAEGSSKIPNFILKPLSEAVQRNLPCDAVIFALAAWARFLQGKDEDGRAIQIEDANAALITGAARKAASDPAGFLIAAGLESLRAAQHNATAIKLKNRLDTISNRGMKPALEELLGM